MQAATGMMDRAIAMAPGEGRYVAQFRETLLTLLLPRATSLSSRVESVVMPRREKSWCEPARSKKKNRRKARLRGEAMNLRQLRRADEPGIRVFVLHTAAPFVSNSDRASVN